MTNFKEKNQKIKVLMSAHLEWLLQAPWAGIGTNTVNNLNINNFINNYNDNKNINDNSNNYDKDRNENNLCVSNHLLLKVLM